MQLIREFGGGTNMKAVVKYDNVDGATELRDVAVPEIGPDDVLVKVGLYRYLRQRSTHAS